jgi:hypothetical protein
MNSVFFRKVNLTAAIAVIAIVAGVFVGCQKEDDQPIMNPDINVPENSISFNSWQEQLDYVIKDENEILSAHYLKLIQYNIIDQTDENSVLELNEDLLVPIYFNSKNTNQFELINIHDQRFDKTSHVNKRSEIIGAFEVSGYKIIKLLWDNDGKLFTSYCFVSEEKQCIVYDDVLSNIRFIKSDENIKKFRIPRLKSGNEGNGSTRLVSIPAYSITGFFGDTKASAGGSLNLKGRGSNITSYDYSCHQTAKAGYSASANITVTAFVPGLNGYIEYVYGVMVGETSNYTLGWNGSSYSVPGGANGVSGGGRINFSEL